VQIEKLREFLRNISPGPIERKEDKDRIIELLSSCWEEIDGNQLEGMTADKLDRMEEPEWALPLLRFLIERHGRTVHGSTRADVHLWEVDVHKGSANYTHFKTRQVRPRHPALEFDRLAGEIVGLILEGKDDPRLKWSPDHSRVTLRIGIVIPKGSGYKQTVAGRRRR
jgi:hypothetical protein